MSKITHFNEEFKRIYEQLEQDNFDAEDDLITLEEKMVEALDYALPTELPALQDLLKQIAETKNEFDIIDEEDALDMMFPDRHEEDFDEDSMSYDSVIGDD
ncbi:MAG: hypothetical protein ACR2IL_06190 [Chitinophagaceae bacterium]